MIIDRELKKQTVTCRPRQKSRERERETERAGGRESERLIDIHLFRQGKGAVIIT